MNWFSRTHSLMCAFGFVVIGCSAQQSGEPSGKTQADRASVETETHAIQDRPSALPLRIALRTADDGKFRDAIDVEITNESAQDREVWLELSGSGLANLESSRSFDAVALAAGASTRVSIRASELPLQASVLPISTLITAGYSQGEGAAPGRVILGDVVMAFSADLTRVALLPRDSASEHLADPSQGADQPFARIYDREAGSYLDLGRDALALDESVEISGQESNPDDIDDLPAGASELQEPSTDKAASTKFCARFRYGFADSGFGEDRLTATPSGTMPAAFVRVNVLRGSTMVFQGFLDSAGCTSTVSTPAGTYTVKLFSRVGRSGKELWAYDNRNDTSLASWSSTVTVSSSTSSTLTVTPTVASDYGGFLALASTALAHFPEGIFGQTNFYIAEGCGTRSDACAGWDPNLSGRRAVFLGSDSAGNRLVLRKFVVAHELGHVIQHLNFGLLSVPFETGAEVAPQCNCSEVSSSNQIHCMQSREASEMAQNEGFGHYIAARILNGTATGSDCHFAYYKHFRHPNGFVEAPPMWIDCRWRYSWNRNNCGGADASTGVELDWLTFYWNLTTTNASFTFAELRLLYIKACKPTCSGDATCFNACSSRNLNGFGIESGAINAWGYGSWQHIHVANLIYNHVL